MIKILKFILNFLLISNNNHEFPEISKSPFQPKKWLRIITKLTVYRRGPNRNSF